MRIRNQGQDFSSLNLLDEYFQIYAQSSQHKAFLIVEPHINFSVVTL